MLTQPGPSQTLAILLTGLVKTYHESHLFRVQHIPRGYEHQIHCPHCKFFLNNLQDIEITLSATLLRGDAFTDLKTGSVTQCFSPEWMKYRFTPLAKAWVDDLHNAVVWTHH